MLSWACILCGYELHAQAVSLVQAKRTRTSVAPAAQSLGPPRRGVHAPADPGQPGAGLFPAISAAFPEPRSTGAFSTQGRHGSMVRVGLLRPSAQPAQARKTGHTAA